MMIDKNLKDIIDKRLVNLKVDEELNDKIMEKINPPKKIMRRPIVTAAAIITFIILTVTVMSSTIPSFRMLLSKINNGFYELLQPVEMTSIDNGIKVEVIAAMRTNDSVITYVTLQDLTQDRIDETVSFHRYKINDNYGSSSVINFDKDTKTATLELITNDTNSSNKFTFYIDMMQSGMHDYRNIETGLDISKIIENKKVEIIPFGINNLFDFTRYPEFLKKYEKADTLDMLKPDEMSIDVIDSRKITNIGIIDEFLHIQIKVKENAKTGGWFSLIDNYDQEVMFSGFPLNIETNKIDYSKNSGYFEYIYDTKYRDLSKCSLMRNMSYYENIIKGNWKVCFNIDKMLNVEKINCDLDIFPMKISSVLVSPFDIKLEGEIKDKNYNNAISVVVVQDNKIITLEPTFDNMDWYMLFSTRYRSKIPLDINKIDKIYIDHKVIYKK